MCSPIGFKRNYEAIRPELPAAAAGTAESPMFPGVSLAGCRGRRQRERRLYTTLTLHERRRRCAAPAALALIHPAYVLSRKRSRLSEAGSRSNYAEWKSQRYALSLRRAAAHSERNQQRRCASMHEPSSAPDGFAAIFMVSAPASLPPLPLTHWHQCNKKAAGTILPQRLAPPHSKRAAHCSLEPAHLRFDEPYSQ
jgi:hypothetical protein